ncbi:MAG: hypothetical protein SNJ29_12855 [Rikenellaceae bacterium]
MDKVCFKYNEHYVTLKDLGKESSDETPEYIKGCKAIIDKYNMMYHYRPLTTTDDETLLQEPIVICYKGREYNLCEFKHLIGVPHHELYNIESINGLEIFNSHQNIMRIANGDCIASELDYSIFIETCRIFQSLYFTMVNARHALFNGLQILHHNNVMPWLNGEQGQFFLRESYICNAIMWYSSAYDILLQCLWIGMRMYTSCEISDNDKKKFSYYDIIAYEEKILTRCQEIESQDKVLFKESDIRGNFNDIINKCRHDKFNALPQYKFLQTFRGRYSKLNKWANLLKHKSGLQFKETYIRSGIALLDSKGQPYARNVELLDIDQIAELLSDYHKDFIGITEQVLQMLHEEFEKIGLILKRQKD